MQKNNKAGMTLVQRGGLLLFTLAVSLVLLAPSGYARRTNIQGGDDAITVFSSQAVTTTPVTSTVNIPVGSTEGLALLVKVTELNGNEEVHLTRLERIRSSEAVAGYAIAPNVSPVIVISHAGESTMQSVYSVAFTEGIESCTYSVSSTTGTAYVSVIAATQ